MPRWSGDTNFMPLLADTDVIPQALEATRMSWCRRWPTTRIRPWPREIELEQLSELLAGGAQLVEVLPTDEYTKAHLPGGDQSALWGRSTKAGCAVLDRGRPVVVYCWDSL